MKGITPPIARIAFALGLVVLIGVALVSYFNSRDLRKKDQAVAHTFEVIGRLQSVLFEMQDVQTGTRGYLLSGEDSYLGPFDAGAARAQGDVDRLKELSADNPRQQERLKALQALVAKRIAISKETVDLRRSKGFAAALKVFRLGKGQDEIRGMIKEMTDGEHALLQGRLEDTARTTGRIIYFQLIGTALGLALLLSIFQLLRHGIRERTRAEQTLRLQASLFDQIHDPVLIWEFRGPIIFWNNGAEWLYGIPRAEALGRVSLDLLRTRMKGGVEEFLQVLERDGRWEGELEHTTRDGRQITVESRMRLVRDARGTSVLEANRNITERKRAEEEIRKLNEQLEQRVTERTAELATANKELETFAYSVSHDLRAPLRAIDGFAQILLEDYKDKLDAPGQDCLHRVCAASQRMAQLIDDMLNLSRVTRHEMLREPVDLSALARNAASHLRAQQSERSVEFVITEDTMVEGDRHLLEVMLENLLSNAWKFTSKQPHARIEFGKGFMEGDGKSIYFVRDNGAGFDMAYAGKLFGAFQRLHAQGEFEGTGVGLATVQRIIHRHGGRIWAEGEVGKGATFSFTL